jgi:hypothetical protein
MDHTSSAPERPIVARNDNCMLPVALDVVDSDPSSAVDGDAVVLREIEVRSHDCVRLCVPLSKLMNVP